MDSCCMALKVNAHLAQASKGGLKNEDQGFWGERLRGSLNNNVLVNQIPKRLSSGKNGRKVKPGVAFSVLTSNDTAVETKVT